MNLNMKEYFVTKLTFRGDENLIQDVFTYEFEGTTLSKGETNDRQWLVNKINNGFNISIITPNLENKTKWKRGKLFTYENQLFKWGQKLPLNMTKRKTFISYYHKEDQEYKERFKKIFDDLIVHKSVEDGDIDSDNSDEYIKQLIQKDYLADTTVLVVLIGPNTKHRKHIDWEMSGALNPKIGDKCAGILGLKLPSHPDYGTGKHSPSKLPARLADNIKSEYAIIRDWTDNRVEMQEYIELAFEKRNTNYEDRVNSRLQMTDDTNE
jgi:hypothetical protein